jgi:hypothetical protein
MYFNILIFNHSDEFNAYLDYSFGLVSVSFERFPDDGTKDGNRMALRMVLWMVLRMALRMVLRMALRIAMRMVLRMVLRMAFRYRTFRRLVFVIKLYFIN